MGKCVNCVYHTQQNSKQNSGEFLKSREKYSRYYNIDSGVYHLCTNDNYKKTDYVTGGELLASCYDKNAFGECVFFSDGTD